MNCVNDSTVVVRCLDCRFLENLIKTSEDLDVEAFSQHCFEYDEVRCPTW